MKISILILLIIPIFVFGQFGDASQQPISWETTTTKSSINSTEISVSYDYIEQVKANNSHASYIAAVSKDVKISFNDFTLVKVMPNGDKLYQYELKSPEAQGISLFFENFTLENGAKLWVFDALKTNFKGVYTSKDTRIDGTFSSSPVSGEEIVVEYLEPKATLSTNFKIYKAYHFFNSLKGGNGANSGFRSSKYCQVNAKCSESTDYSAELTSTCRILVYGTNFAGYCTGTLMNNTRQDHTPYILSANHCSNNSSLADLPDWEFQFNYQSSNCSTPGSEPSNTPFKGCTAVAYTGADGGENSSDFLLMKLVSAIPESLGLNYMGWDRSGSLASSGLCFHHPAGDIKKISVFKNSLQSGSYGGNVSGTHFVVNWDRTTNGFGVTEGGSSGSGLLNANGQLIGTLTGGTSECGGSVVDMYGKIYYHWDRNGSSSNIRLKDWLDPTNSGATSLKSTNSTLSISALASSEELTIMTKENGYEITLGNLPFELNVYNMLGNRIFNLAKNRLQALPVNSNNKQIYIIEAIEKERKIVKKIEL